MKFATVKYLGRRYVGLVRGEEFIPLGHISRGLPDDMLQIIEGYDRYESVLKAGLAEAEALCSMSQVEYLPPLPNPRSFRDFMGFAEHFENCKRQYGLTVPPKYYEIPVFYFSNHQALRGSGEVVPAQPSSHNRDFEFEIGFVIGTGGKNIPAEKALEHIFGFTVLNDWSARDIQMEEQSVGLGPAKGKDYATSMGPVLVTRDELMSHLCPDDPQRFDLKTKLTLNGNVMRENNTKSILHTFGAMIQRASTDVELFPGELFGSGTLGGGTLMEYSREEYPFLQPGDRIEMEVEGIGTLVSLVG